MAGEIKRNHDGTIAPGSAAINPGGRPKKLREFGEFLDAMDPDFTSKSRRARVWERMYLIATTARPTDAVRAMELMCGYDMGKPAQAIIGDDGEPARFGLVILPAREKNKGE